MSCGSCEPPAHSTGRGGGCVGGGPRAVLSRPPARSALRQLRPRPAPRRPAPPSDPPPPPPPLPPPPSPRLHPAGPWPWGDPARRWTRPGQHQLPVGSDPVPGCSASERPRPARVPAGRPPPGRESGKGGAEGLHARVRRARAGCRRPEDWRNMEKVDDGLWKVEAGHCHHQALVLAFLGHWMRADMPMHVPRKRSSFNHTQRPSQRLGSTSTFLHRQVLRHNA